MDKVTHFLYTPFSGLGLYGGHRGRRWLRNRIKIFKQFVIPSIQAQTNQNLVLWVSWRHEDIGDGDIQELERHIKSLGLRTIFTYSGVCFWDDKYPDDVARDRLIKAVHGSMGELINEIGESQTVLMTIQPSDDCYYDKMVEETQTFFKENPHMDVFGYRRGYVMDYVNDRLADWNPTTTPPFYTIKFTRENFTETLKHINFTGPYKSHEYVKDFMKATYIDTRAFLVGTHGENISTIFNHPFAGHEYLGDNVWITKSNFGLQNARTLLIRTGLRKTLMRKLPRGWQRKLRYWLGERFYAKIYDFLRS